MEQTPDIQALFVIEPLQQSTGSEVGGGATCSNCNCNSNSNGSSEELLA